MIEASKIPSVKRFWFREGVGKCTRSATIKVILCAEAIILDAVVDCIACREYENG